MAQVNPWVSTRTHMCTCGDHTHIMHHFSMELLFNFQLCTYPYLNTDSHSSMDFHLSPYSHQSTCPIQMSLKSIFKDSSDIEMEDLSKPNTLKLKLSLQSSSLLDQPIDMTVPIHGTPCCSSATPMHPLWFPAYMNDISIALSFPTNHYFLHIYNPRDQY